MRAHGFNFWATGVLLSAVVACGRPAATSTAPSGADGSATGDGAALADAPATHRTDTALAADLASSADSAADTAAALDVAGPVDGGPVDGGPFDSAPADAAPVDGAAPPDVAPAPDTAALADIPAASDAAVGKPVPDPIADGPWKYSELDDKASVAATGDSVAIHCAYPATGNGPFPLVILAHGFQLAPSKYYGYIRRLATFGYVALTVDYPTNPLGNDNPKQAEDLSAGIDWALAHAALAGKVDAALVGVTGHSLGGKVALLAAKQDPRFKAVFAMDPVDGGGPLGCPPPQCADVSAMMPTLAVPTAFIGETTDATGGFQPCAPAANNFKTFYAGALHPALSVTVLGANHMSFLDDTKNCLACGFCNKATLDQAKVLELTRSYMVAFFERRLRGLTGYDAYLTGQIAQDRYVKTNQAKIEAK